MREAIFPVRVLAIVFSLAYFLVVEQGATAQMRQVYLDNLQPDNEIRKLSFYSASEGYVGFANWIGYTTDSGRTFTKKYITISNVNFNGYPVNLTFGFYINGIKAFNQNILIAYGHYGLVPAILRSVDGGNTFTLVFHSTYYPDQLRYGIYDMVFPENNATGFAVDADRILKTVDQGLTWSLVHVVTNKSLYRLEGIDNNTVYATGDEGLFLKTTNGGNTWTNVLLPLINRPSWIYSISFINANTGWMCLVSNNYEGYIFKTTNGGNDWVLQNNIEATPVVGEVMKFIDNNVGYIVAGQNTVYKTLDGGKIWEPLLRDNNFSYLGYSHNSLQTISTNQLWAGGGHGLLELSTNGGGVPLPKAYFRIDTLNLATTNTVNLINYSRPGYQFTWIVNGVQISTSYNASYTHNFSRAVDSIKLIAKNGQYSDTVLKLQYFYAIPSPTITSFAPSSGSVGSSITIRGTRLSGVTTVRFGTTVASSFSIISDDMITAVVGNGSSGSIVLSSLSGSTSKSGFVYFPPPVVPAPKILSIVPESGPVGSVITIMGNNFDPIATNNQVQFGSTIAQITASTSTQITCIVPAGSSFERLSVRNLQSKLTGYSLKPFNITFADSGNFTTHSFRSVQSNIRELSFLQHTLSNDIDGDGRVDVITYFKSQSVLDSVFVWKNLSMGGNFSFESRKAICNIKPYASNFDLGDLDGDGKADLALYDIGNIKVLLNKSTPGTISFDTGTYIGPFGRVLTYDTKIIDIDNDGRNDLLIRANGAFSDGSEGGISIYRNTSSPGNPSFAPPYHINRNKYFFDFAFGDIDGDGKVELLATWEDKFLCFRNNSVAGTISFLPESSVTVSNPFMSANRLSVVDFDGDDMLDIVYLGQPFRVFRNNSQVGNIAFGSPTQIEGQLPIFKTVGFANLNGDSKPDMFNRYIDSIRLTEIKSVSSVIDIQEGVNVLQSTTLNLTSADLNGDGKIDLIHDYQTGYLNILENRVGEDVELEFCEGISNSITSDVNSTTHQWQWDIGNGFVNLADNSYLTGTQSSSLQFTNLPFAWNGYKFRCLGSGNLKSSVFVLKVRPKILPSVSIVASATTGCFGTFVSYTPTVNNAGSMPLLDWQINGVSQHTSLYEVYRRRMTGNDSVRVIVTSTTNEFCSLSEQDTSNVIKFTLMGPVAEVQVNASSTDFCTGSLVTFTATPSNNGPTVNYRWIRNSTLIGGNSNSFSSNTLSNGDEIRAGLSTTPNGCPDSVLVLSNIIVMNVTSPVTPSVVAQVTPNTDLCSGAPATFTALPANGGSNPQYQWKINDINVGTNSNQFVSSNLKNNDLVKVVLTSNLSCLTVPSVTSNVLNMRVESIVNPSISIAGKSLLSPGESTLISSSAVNGGLSPIYQWEDSTSALGWRRISSINSPSINYTPSATGNKLRNVLTSSINCSSPRTVNSNIITFTITTVTSINPVPGNSLGINLYPNPVRDVLIIDNLKLFDRWETLELVSVDGRNKLRFLSIARQTKLVVNVADLANGYYLALLKRRNGAPVYLKFLKQ